MQEEDKLEVEMLQGTLERRGFEALPFCGPVLNDSTMGVECVKSLMNLEATLPDDIIALGNVRECWHGTHMSTVPKIARGSLKVAGDRNAFGAGIYFAPDYKKSVAYAKRGPRKFKRGFYRRRTNGWGLQFRSFGALLKCRVALGCIYYPKTTGSGVRLEMSENGCHSVVWDYGMRTAGYYSSSNRGEWVIYNPRQVVVEEVHIYFFEEKGREYTSVRQPPTPQAQPLPPVPPHPCSQGGFNCTWAAQKMLNNWSKTVVENVCLLKHRDSPSPFHCLKYKGRG